MLVGALYFFESLMSMQSLTDSDKNSILDAIMHPCKQDSLYLQFKCINLNQQLQV